MTFEGSTTSTTWKEDVLALATGGFAEEVEEVECGLRVFFDESALDAIAQVTDMFVGEEDRGAVEVVVVYDRECVGGDEDRSANRTATCSCRCSAIDGEWLVDNVIDIASSERR